MLIITFRKQEIMDYFKLEPYFSPRLWGSDRLATEFNYDLQGATNIGEAWVLSGMPGKASIINNPDHPWHQKSFDQFVTAHLDLLPITNRLGIYPLLAKIITPKQNLSVQVHPDDAYAWTHEKALGKPEGWFVLDCPSDSEIIYGHHATNHADLARKIKQGSWDDLLQKIPVTQHNFYYLPPGTIHALTKDVVVYELQQSSDVTYRLYDYDRVDPIIHQKRELHQQQSLDTITVPNQNVIMAPGQVKQLVTLNFETDLFQIVVLTLTGETTSLTWQGHSAGHVTCLQGELTLFSTVKITAGETIFLYNVKQANMKVTGAGRIIICWPILAKN